MSEQFNIGDDVIVVNDFSSWLTSHGLSNDTVLKVVDNQENESDDYVYPPDLTIEIEALKTFPEDFQVVSKLKENVEIEVMIGDYVEVLVPLERFTKEQTIEVGTVLKVVATKPGPWFVKGDTIEIGAMLSHRSKFKLVPAPVGEQCPETIIPMTRIEKEETVRAEDIGQFIEDRVKEIIQPDLGVYRPQLETRKVGKVRVELVDKGFPNALWEVARLMTKAQEVKGYADHDWKNLPNWKEAFSAAASRHRMKHNKGELYDDEFEDFKILHKVNEAFNVLAELELMLNEERQESIMDIIKQMCITKSK